MPWVQSGLSWKAFRGSRKVVNAVYREDLSAGYVVGWVDVARDGDEAISRVQAESIERAIRTYNAALPKETAYREKVALRASARASGASKLEALGLTAEEVKALSG